MIDNGFRPDPAKIAWRWIPPEDIRCIEFSDCAEEYVIEKYTDPPVAGEVVLWGRYRNHGWIINPWNCRYVVAELLRQIKTPETPCQPLLPQV